MTVSCSENFFSRINAFCHKKQVNAAELVRAGLLILTPAAIAALPAIEEEIEERESVTIKSGKNKGRRLLRKPRLQLRLPLPMNAEDAKKILNWWLVQEENKTKFPPLSPVIINALAFTPLPKGIKNRREALYVLGFPPDAMPSAKIIKEKYLNLAKLFHPDGECGDHERMTQLNAAFKLLAA
ncbi:MAG: J domain-containing protein [Dongiaceae bacterium]